MFLAGVMTKYGKKYNELQITTKLYIKYPDEWNDTSIKTIYINQNEDEKILTNIVQLDYTNGTDNFIELGINHFSPHMVYNEFEADNEITEHPEINNPQIFDDLVISLLGGIISFICLISIICYIITTETVVFC